MRPVKGRDISEKQFNWKQKASFAAEHPSMHLNPVFLCKNDRRNSGGTFRQKESNIIDIMDIMDLIDIMVLMDIMDLIDR